MYECNICNCLMRNLSDDGALHRDLENMSNSIDICSECIQKRKRINTSHTIVETPISGCNRCDFCKNEILSRHSIVSSILFICSSCLDPSVSLETVDRLVNEMLFN